jgi:nicotinic acid phosphoribosyltransferase
MPSILTTDGYKFSMAAAGWPLRRETFYYTHRQGGPHLLPFDMAERVKALLPTLTDALEGELAWLEAQGYRMGGAWKQALTQQVEVCALPRGSWFFDREPAFSVTGPSALVSWLEPLIIQLHYPIQVATLARLHPDQLASAVAHITCQQQAQLVTETLDAVGVAAPTMQISPGVYREAVTERLQALVDVVGDPSRIFEVGMRAATCTAQHRLALEACRDVGIRATSNGQLAQELGLDLVGTMGHEHVQRYRSDPQAFRAMRERHPGPTSFLLDTFSTLDSGLPAAFELIAEDPSRGDSIRYDSGDKEGQYLYATVRAKALGIQPRHVLEDGFDLETTTRFEALRDFTGLAPENQIYGYGGHIVRSPSNPLTRDRVQAVYKLAQTGPWATMKWGDELGGGKESIPGQPILYRRYNTDGTWTGVVAQAGEKIAGEVVELSGAELPRRIRFTVAEAQRFGAIADRPEKSPATRALMDELYDLRSRRLGSMDGGR